MARNEAFRPTDQPRVDHVTPDERPRENGLRGSSTMALLLFLLLALPSLAQAFDYRLETLEPVIRVTRGMRGVNILHATLLEGPPADITLSASGLPTGVSVQFMNDGDLDNTLRFDREGGHPPFNSTYTVLITTGATIPLGSHPITLTGSGGGIGTRSTAFTLNVAAIPTSNTFYVSPSGCSDGGPGTSGSPWCTLQKAANTVTSGGTIIVQSGTYHERVNLVNSGSSGAPITWIGMAGARYHTDTAIGMGNPTSAFPGTLPPGGFTFVTGKFYEAPVDTAQTITLAHGQYTEIEGRFALGAPLVATNTLQIRLQRNSGADMDNYGSSTRTLTMADPQAAG